MSTAPTYEELARNPETTADVLKTIYEYKRRESDRQNAPVMAALAQNPNTPVEILSGLLFHHTPAFCLNPLAPLVLLEKPTFVTAHNDTWQLKFLACADAPAPLVRTLLKVKDVSVASEAKYHIALGPDFEPGHWEAEFRALCRDYCQNPKSADEKQFHADYAELGFLPHWPGTQQPIPKLSDKTLSKELNGYPGRSEEERLLVRMFAPDIEPDLFRKLQKTYPGTVVETAFALCPQTPGDVLREIASRDYCEERVRLLCARHANADADLLALFASDNNPVLRRLARAHKNAPANVRKLCQAAASGKKGSTPLWVLINSLHDKPAMKELRTRFESPFWMVRLSVALAITSGNVRISEERLIMLRELTRDANRFVRAAAKAGLADPNYRFSLTEGE